MRGSDQMLGTEPDWYRDAIVYELHVRAFADSDGDGIGDFDGLRSRLGYLEDLGVNAIWLLPFSPSPLRDDGYDISSYDTVHPDYGTLAAFRRFLSEAHRRGLRVITELVVNHTSDQHPWFERARRSPPGSRFRDFYVWSDTPDRYADARVIFSDFEQSNWSWDPVAGAYFWHRFYHHQPDLNYASPQVQHAMLRVVDHWLGMGVDGLRLDAVPYLFEREGTSCENLPETHEFLREVRAHVDARHRDRLLLAEANQWPEDASAYFGDGDECHMAFHFPLMPRLFMGLRMEDRFPIVDILQQTPATPPGCQWALFLRNHDELTLEMVTDEERDYMYRAYAGDPAMRVNLGIRRRLAPLLENHRQKIELMLGLLLSLPGTPFLYYGDEIGMGDNVYLGDRDSVRTPMQWSADRNAGFSSANPQRLFLPVVIDPEYHSETINVEAQQHNPQSLLWWVRRLIALRKRYRVFGRGDLEILAPDNPHVLAFLRSDGDTRVLVVANLSRFAQYVELDLAHYRGHSPLELFGRTEFPMVGELPYLLTLGPHSFYWLELSAPKVEPPDGSGLPELRVPGRWRALFEPAGSQRLEAALPRLLSTRRWFAGKDRQVVAAHLLEAAAVGKQSEDVIAFVAVEYLDGPPDTYVIPVAFAPDGEADWLTADHPEIVLARVLPTEGPPGLLYDAHWDAGFARGLLRAVTRRTRSASRHDPLRAIPMRTVDEPAAAVVDTLPTQVLGGEQSNTSIQYGDQYVLKTFRRFEPGVNPDLEIGRRLGARRYGHAAAVIGALDYTPEPGTEGTVAILHRFVPNEGDAWEHVTGGLGRFYEQVLALDPLQTSVPPLRSLEPLHLRDAVPPESFVELTAGWLAEAELLGRRTGELHAALADDTDPAFAPVPVTALYQRSVYQSMRTGIRRTLRALHTGVATLPPGARTLAQSLLAREGLLLDHVARVRAVAGGERIRLHGDLHLGQVLFTGRDFVFIDFEGEPARARSERALKRSPLRDVAGMLRSFDYAARTALRNLDERGLGEPERAAARGVDVTAWRRAWVVWSGASFLRGYFDGVPENLLPQSDAEVESCLDAHLVEKAAYELRYELGNRPSWAEIPLAGIDEILGRPTGCTS